jgi:hypothetical protein
MWTAHLFKTTSGEIGPRLNFENMDWSIELNGTESINMKLRKSDLPAVDLRYWLSPWWAGVVLLWNNEPIVAGPLITRPSESFDFITIGCGGIRSIMAKRLVAKDLTDTSWANFNTDLLTYSGLSLGTIAKRVVAASQQKIGGQLPITYALPDYNGIHERNYKSFNVSNISADDVLTKLSNVIGGPDIMFKPRLLRPNQLTFDLWTGTDAQPRIFQKYSPVWDTTPAKGMVSNVNVIVTGTYQTSRVYATGAGQDEGTIIQVVTDNSLLQQGYPLLETVVTEGSSENPNVVRDHALSGLDINNGSLLEIQMTVRTDGVVPLGTFWPGDLVDIVTKGWLSLPDGVNRMRLLSITGDHTNNVKISLQKEDKFA